MKLQITLEEIQELQTIRNMLSSPDNETRLMGISLMETLDKSYNIWKTARISKNSTLVDIYWYINRTKEIFNENNILEDDKRHNPLLCYLTNYIYFEQQKIVIPINFERL